MSQEDNSILVTKLYFPQVRFQLVSRPRLVEKVEQGLTRRLTLLSASAGYGKTTLLSEWRQTRPDQTVAWLSLDAGDNDPARFLAYIEAALKTVLPEIALSSPENAFSPQPQNVKLALTRLINSLSAQLTRHRLPGLVLVMEDYHVIEAEIIHTAVSFLINNMPPEMHLIITSRTEPALPLHRLMAQDQLVKLGTADLRFTPAETAAFMQQSGSPAFRADDLEQLAARTEGWAVGLQLAALSLKDRRDVKNFFSAFSGNNRFVLGYLGEEVLNNLPEHIRSFLLQTAIFERFNVDLVESVCEIKGATRLLEYLNEANLFLVPLDETGQWYRYHRLFAEFLLHRLRQEDPVTLVRLHHRSGRWFEQAGLTAEAIPHYLLAADFENAARLIEKVGWPMITRGELTTLDAWLKQLPGDIFHSSPTLCLYYAWKLYLRRQFEQQEHFLQRAEAAWRVEDNRVGLGEIYYLRAYSAQSRGDYQSAIAYAEQALKVLPEGELAKRGNAYDALGWACLTSGEAARSHYAFSQGRQQCHKSGNILGEFSCLYGLADAIEMQGRFKEAKPLYDEALRLLPGKPEFLAQIEIRLGQLYLEWNNLDLASRYLEQVEKLDEQGVDLTPLSGSYMFMAEMWWVRGDYERAFERLSKAQELAAKANYSFALDQMKAYEGWLWLNQGDFEQLERWREANFPDLAELLERPFTYQDEQKYMTLAGYLLAEHKLDDALRLLTRQENLAREQGRTYNLMQVLAVKAVAYYLGGDLAAATPVIEQVLIQAEREGYRRIFVNRGEPMRKLLLAVSPRLPAQANFLRDLLAEHFPEKSLPADRPSSFQVGTHPGNHLSERELEVLRLINSGASNQKIAETLVLAVTTVKKHLTRIFDKLEVTSRTEALARARELDLL